MTDNGDKFLSLLKEGKLAEARELLKQEIENSKFSPDTIKIDRKGNAKFTKKRKAVELGPDKKWRLKIKD